MRSVITQFYRWTWFVAPVLLLVLLVARNPYSERNLIANLEPFPDAQYYTTPPQCFLAGESWKMCRMPEAQVSAEGITPSVPPLYSVLLLPIYALISDVRSFYFLNVSLVIFSYYLLYRVLKNFAIDYRIIGTILFIFSSTYYIYWFPTLAMAEHVFIPLFLLSILVLQREITYKTSIIVGLLSGALYAAKYAYAPLVVILPFVYVLKILFTKNTTWKAKITQGAIVTGAVLSTLSLLLDFRTILSVATDLVRTKEVDVATGLVTSDPGFFSRTYFSDNIVAYSQSLLGGSQRVLWDWTPLVNRWIAIFGLIGLGMWRRYKPMIFSQIFIVLATFSQLFFIALFYVVDLRYMVIAIPALLIGFSLFLQAFFVDIAKRNLFRLLVAGGIILIVLVSQFSTLKKTIVVNFKYAETPWWYVSQQHINGYFSEYSDTTQKPYLITLSSPFYSDNFSNHHYQPLPMSTQQDFWSKMPQVWGEDDYSDLLTLYEQKINSGSSVYITNYGISAALHLQERFETITSHFNSEVVSTGCHEVCNIYRLTISDNTEANSAP